MPRDWNPNAPKIGEQFNQDRTPKPDPVSKTELEKLRAEREKPAPAPTPPGLGTPNKANDGQKLEREKRIAYIEGQLKKNRGKVRQKFGRK